MNYKILQFFLLIECDLYKIHFHGKLSSALEGVRNIRKIPHIIIKSHGWLKIPLTSEPNRTSLALVVPQLASFLPRDMMILERDIFGFGGGGGVTCITAGGGHEGTTEQQQPGD